MSVLTVIIPTLNEELHIGRAVRSAVTIGEVFVVDSGSSDRTREIAEAAGAKFVFHEWSGYSAQKNWALDYLPIETDWVFFLDADEIVTPALAAEVKSVMTNPTADGYYVARRNVFLGRELKHAWWYPDYQLRLFRRSAGRYENRLVHEHVILHGQEGFLSNHLVHENLKSIDEFLRRHERYADLEAEEIRANRRGIKPEQSQRTGALSGSWPERRRWLKLKVWYRMPARPAVRFLWMFLFKRGFLDGRQGLVYCQLLAAYEAMIDAKILELDQSPRVRQLLGSAEPLLNTVRTLLVCSDCQSLLSWRDESVACERCNVSYQVVDGIPIMTSNRVKDKDKEFQAEYYDKEVNPEFELTRPHSTPTMYRCMLEEEFRRSVVSLGTLSGKTVLTVCGGSGMDAEFLARAGATVIASDISLGAAKRTRERADRFGVELFPIVADVEHLPFADRSIDLVYVHDGLHHLTDPFIGLREMARVAKWAVSVTEPAQAELTRLAVKLGRAEEIEEAGNRVERLQPAAVADALREQGLRTLRAERYAMYYKHHPGPVMRALSLPVVHQLAWMSWRLGNGLIGRYGNKMTVQAVRGDS